MHSSAQTRMVWLHAYSVFIFLLCLPTICQKLEAALHFYFRGISVLYQNSYIWYLVLKVVV